MPLRTTETPAAAALRRVRAAYREDQDARADRHRAHIPGAAPASLTPDRAEAALRATRRRLTAALSGLRAARAETGPGGVTGPS